MSSQYEKPYSYHAFLLPFIIREGKEEVFATEELLRKEYWEKSKDGDLRPFHCILPSIEDRNSQMEFQIVGYAQHQYFHENVRKVLHGDQCSDVTQEFLFKFGDEDTKKYIICSKDDETGTEREYSLSVSNIRLKLFNTGIGVLIFELSNHRYRSFKEVKEINEFGRHISLPFIGGVDILCAEVLKWDFLYKDENREYNFREKNSEFLGGICREKTYMVDLIPKIILDNPDRYEVVPALDDRMFTCCLIQENNLSEKIKTGMIESSSIYEYIYIDKEGQCTAPTEKFRNTVLEESLYQRWSSYGTLYGSSHTSLMGITGEANSLTPVIVRPFLTQYVEIAILALVQRASILKFQKDISGHLNNAQIAKLQQRYINYRNQLHFFEVSSQEQAIELYELIRRQLYIEKEMNNLEKNLELLYEKVNVEFSRKVEQIGLFIGIVSLLSLISVIVDICEICAKSYICCSAVVILILLIVFGGFRFSKKFLKEN